MSDSSGSVAIFGSLPPPIGGVSAHADGLENYARSHEGDQEIPDKPWGSAIVNAHKYPLVDPDRGVNSLRLMVAN